MTSYNKSAKKIGIKASQKAKDFHRVDSDDLIQALLSKGDDAVAFFSGLKKEEQDQIIAKALLMLLRKNE